MSVRIERDLLGEREVPADAYWGVHTLRAIENFPMLGRTISDCPEFVRGMVEVKKAAALANRDTKAASAEVTDAIVAGCDALLNDGVAMDQFPIDMFQGGAGTSTNMNANEVVANLALELLGKEKGDYAVIHPNDDVNKSQSTNDAYPTGLRLATVRMVQQLVEEISALADSVLAFAEKHEDTVKMGRTQMQDAVPMTVGQEFHGYYSMLKQEMGLIEAAAKLLLTVNMGGTAIGTCVNVPEGYPEAVVARLSEVTGLEIKLSDDLVMASPNTGDLVSMHGALKRFATNLSKFANDLRLLSSGPRAGIGELKLPEMQAGSSIMPAKVNPVIPEVVSQACIKVIGNDMTVAMASEAGQLQLNAMEPVMAEALLESVRLLTNACSTFRIRCIDGLEVNTEVARQNVMNSIGLVTYLNDVIGHAAGDAIGKEAAATGKNVREIVLERGLMTSAELDEIFSRDNLVHPQYRGEIFE